MMRDPASGHRQPIVTLGTPDHDVTNRAALLALAGVAFVFLVCILAYAVASNRDDGGAAADGVVAAPAAVATVDASVGSPIAGRS